MQVWWSLQSSHTQDRNLLITLIVSVMVRQKSVCGNLNNKIQTDLHVSQTTSLSKWRLYFSLQHLITACLKVAEQDRHVIISSCGLWPCTWFVFDSAGFVSTPKYSRGDSIFTEQLKTQHQLVLTRNYFLNTTCYSAVCRWSFFTCHLFDYLHTTWKKDSLIPETARRSVFVDLMMTHAAGSEAAVRCVSLK